MSRMLADTPYRRYSVYKGWRGSRKPSEVVEYRRNQRARERDEFRRLVSEETG
jgi:hypothetical protein